MKKDKQEMKVDLVSELIDKYDKQHDKNQWNENDIFDVACWFLGDMILRICDAHIIPEDELRERIKKKLSEHVDDVFEQLQKIIDNENEEGIQKAEG